MATVANLSSLRPNLGSMRLTLPPSLQTGMSAIALPSPGGSRPDNCSLHDALEAAVASIASPGGHIQSMEDYGKFGGTIKQMSTGAPVQAALGLHRLLGVSEAEILCLMGDPVESIREEFLRHGSMDDLWCLDYVLNQPAGMSDREWPNGKMDEGRRSETFDDFVNHPSARSAGLDAGHVLAIRMYTTNAYRSLNVPLRNTKRKEAHPFPVTILKLSDGIKKLRAVAAGVAGAHEPADLYRGMRDMRVTADFERRGGSELACMSTTTDIVVALKYSASQASLLLKLRTSSFMDRGADIAFLSAFPGEREVLFPPLTYLKPTKRREVLKLGEGATCTVVEVTVAFPS